MYVFALTAGLVVLADQAVKMRVQRSGRIVSLGKIGSVRTSDATIWLTRGVRRGPLTIWACWVSGAAGLAAAVAILPSLALWAGLLAGGSLSHALETARRGRVIDYVCLTFWPAFNLADALITIGAAGVLIRLGAAAWKIAA